MPHEPTVLRHPGAQMEALVKSFAASPSIGGLVGCFGYALQHRLSTDELESTYDVIGVGALWTPAAASVLGAFLATVELAWPGASDPEPRATPDPLTGELGEAFKGLWAALASERALSDDIAQPGFGFPLARELAIEASETDVEAIPEQQLECALQVSRYVRAFFSRSPAGGPRERLRVVAESPAGRFLARVISDCIGELSEQHTSAAGDVLSRRSAATLLSYTIPGKLPEDLGVGRYFLMLCLSPQGVFDCEVRAWLSGQRSQLHSIEAILFFVAFLPLCSSDYPLASQCEARVRRLIDLKGDASSTPTLSSIMEHLARQKALKAAFVASGIGPGVPEPSVHEIPVLDWLHVEGLFETICATLDQDVGSELATDAVAAFVRHVALSFWLDGCLLPLRRSQLADTFSLLSFLRGVDVADERFAYDWTRDALSSLFQDDASLLPFGFCGIFDPLLGLLLENAYDREAWRDGVAGPVAVASESRSSLSAAIERNWASALQVRRELYRRLISAAAESGMHELASALAACLITSQAHLAGTPGLGHWDAALMGVLRRSPGWKHVEDSIRLSLPRLVGSAGKSYVDVLWLQSYSSGERLPGSAPHTRTTHHAIERRLASLIGTQVWMAFQPDTKERLVESERSWERHHDEAGTTKRHWNALGQELATAVEHEVLCRMKPLFSSAAYKAFQARRGGRAKHQSLGAVRFVFEQPNLPSDLLAELSTCAVRLSDAAVLARFGELVELRNVASHAGSFGEASYLRLRELVYRDGLLAEMFPSGSSGC